jgi:F1F0 ATPase subunit 2
MSMTISTILSALLGLLAGAALGVLFFRSLAVTVDRCLDGGIRRVLPLYALRVAGAVAAFTLAALAGAAALLGMLAGFHAARVVIVRREKARNPTQEAQS